MPPALSDDDRSQSSASDEEHILPRADKDVANADDDAEEDDEEDEEEDVYVVESILSHKMKKGTFIYEVKWQGYEDAKDRTWEPTENLQGALDVLHEYWDSIGGDPAKRLKSTAKRKSRKSIAGSESTTPASTKKIRTEPEWAPPLGLWEEHVSHIDTVEEQRDPTTNRVVKFAYLVWINQKKTQHPLKDVYLKCPQKMLSYYEDHLIFTTHDTLVNGHKSDEAKDDLS